MMNINELLKEHNLLHYQFFEDGAKIVYTHDSGTSTHVQDYSRLIAVLKENNIKHDDIGIDVIMVVEESKKTK